MCASHINYTERQRGRRVKCKLYFLTLCEKLHQPPFRKNDAYRRAALPIKECRPDNKAEKKINIIYYHQSFLQKRHSRTAWKALAHSLWIKSYLRIEIRTKATKRSENYYY